MRYHFTLTLLVGISLSPLLIGCGSTPRTEHGSPNTTDKVPDKPTTDKPVEIEFADKLYIDYVFSGTESYGNQKYKDRIVSFLALPCDSFHESGRESRQPHRLQLYWTEQNGPKLFCDLSPEGAKQYLDNETEIKEGKWKIQGICRGLIKSEPMGKSTVADVGLKKFDQALISPGRGHRGEERVQVRFREA